MTNREYLELHPLSDIAAANPPETLPVELSKIVNDGQLFCASCNASVPSDVEVFANVDGKQVVAFVGMDWWEKSMPYSVCRELAYGGDSIHSVTLYDGIKLIGSFAFQGCESLEKLRLPSTLQHIGERAFACCYALEYLTLPCFIRSIGKGAFSQCASLRYVKIPGATKIVPEACFWGCYNLKSVTLEEGVERIDKDAFAYCEISPSDGINIEIPSSVQYIHDNAFAGCRGVKLCVRDNSYGLHWARTHGYRRIDSCWDASGYWIRGEGVTVKQKNGCNAAWEIGLLEGCKDKYWLGKCLTPNVEITVLPTTHNRLPITKIMRKALSFQESYIDDEYDETYETEGVLETCCITEIPEGITTLDDCLFSFKGEGKRIFEMRLPQTLVEIGAECFCGQQFEEIWLPLQIRKIGRSAFSYCHKLQQIEIPGSLKVIEARLFHGCGNLKMVNIQHGVEIIAEEAFCSCKSLKMVRIPPSVRSIHFSAFDDCPDLVVFCQDWSYAHFFATGRGIRVQVF